MALTPNDNANARANDSSNAKRKARNAETYNWRGFAAATKRRVNNNGSFLRGSNSTGRKRAAFEQLFRQFFECNFFNGEANGFYR